MKDGPGEKKNTNICTPDSCTIITGGENAGARVGNRGGQKVTTSSSGRGTTAGEAVGGVKGTLVNYK